MKKIIISLALIATGLTALVAYKKIKSKLELFQSIQINEKGVNLGAVEINDKGVKVGDFEVNEQGIKGGDLVQINDKGIKLGDVEVKLK